MMAADVLVHCIANKNTYLLVDLKILYVDVQQLAWWWFNSSRSQVTFLFFRHRIKKWLDFGHLTSVPINLLAHSFFTQRGSNVGRADLRSLPHYHDKLTQYYLLLTAQSASEDAGQLLVGHNDPINLRFLPATHWGSEINVWWLDWIQNS